MGGVSSLSEHVAQQVVSPGILPAGGRILVAVSGGVDSMVLLHVLHELTPAHQWTLVVAHLNHQLRGRSSQADARFVQDQCGRLGLPCVVGSRDVQTVAKRRKISVEMAAREARHRFLVQAARRRRCPVVVLAHHADDQAELVLLRLLRGSGSEGLAGMRVCSPSPMNPAIRLVRPLLEVSREQIDARARDARIRFREDRSNRDPRFLRNRIRHELLPLLSRDYQPAIQRVLTRTASILAAESECIREQAQAWLTRRRGSFEGLPRAVRRQVVQQQALELGVVLDFETCEELVRVGERPVNVPGGIRLRRDARGGLRRVDSAGLAHLKQRRDLQLSSSGRASFAGREFQWSIRRCAHPVRVVLRSCCEVFDAERVGRSIVLRHWRAGDRFQPIGMPNSAKLQDLFTNLKVSRIERRTRVIAETENREIFWVEGLRIGECFKLRPGTRKTLVWRWNC
jgi:tRNA(Ile)-lysidine synthase